MPLLVLSDDAIVALVTACVTVVLSILSTAAGLAKFTITHFDKKWEDHGAQEQAWRESLGHRLDASDRLTTAHFGKLNGAVAEIHDWAQIHEQEHEGYKRPRMPWDKG